MAVADTLNFTRAAERVHVTQSTLSHQIKQLEDEIGELLFERNGKRVYLSESGEIFFGFATRVLRELDDGIRALKNAPNQHTGTIRIGTTHTFNIDFIPTCVAIFLQRFPSVKVTVTETTAAAINDAIRTGSLDIGIAYRPTEQNELIFQPLYNENMVLVVAEHHPFARRKRLRLSELHRYKLVLLSQEYATRQMLDEYFASCGVVPQVVAEMNTVSPMVSLVKRTELGTIISANAIGPAQGLRAIPLESPTPVRTPGIILRDSEEQEPLVRSFASIVRKIATDSVQGPSKHVPQAVV